MVKIDACNATSRVPRFDVDATILQRRHFRLKKW